MMVKEQKTTINGGVQRINEWVLNLHTIPNSFPFREGQLIQSLILEKAKANQN
jgi:hypothetical protein